MLTLVLATILCAADIVEMDDFLFVQNAAQGAKGYYVMWIPEPLQKICMGKTGKQCAEMDFCIRTTTKDVAMCRNLPKLPSYPVGMRPRRVLSITYMEPGNTKVLEFLRQFHSTKPGPAFDRLSMGVRVKARLKLTRGADDDSFEVLEVSGVAQ
jgi:hypothetical protein